MKAPHSIPFPAADSAAATALILPLPPHNLPPLPPPLLILPSSPQPPLILSPSPQPPLISRRYRCRHSTAITANSTAALLLPPSRPPDLLTTPHFLVNCHHCHGCSYRCRASATSAFISITAASAAAAAATEVTAKRTVYDPSCGGDENGNGGCRTPDGSEWFYRGCRMGQSGVIEVAG